LPEAIILGSGTSNGVPMLGWSYPPGYLDNPKNHRTRASMLLLGPSGNVQVDCPPELRLQLTGAGITNLDAVIVTHAHADHVMGMDDLRSLCILTGRAIPIYTLPVHQEDIRRIYPYAFRDPPPGVAFPRFDLRDIPTVLEAAGLRIQTFTVAHGTVPVTGLRVGDMAYITDVSEIPEEARRHLDGLETLVIDAVRVRPHPNHFHLAKALEVAEEIAATKTYLTHLGHDYDHDVTNKELPAGVELAYDGLRIGF
jgi:phosphoribosyl 1,2-cyclic phosphate phosphodiesterase